jgi:hypothetical protein
MFLYSQIGYLYILADRVPSATDYFKKQLVLSWHQKSLVQEQNAYESLACCYYMMHENPDNMQKAIQYNERATMGLIELENSMIRNTWVKIWR